MSVERRGTKALELWARRATDGYVGVSISNMTTAWRNGLAFCALIHRFRPDLIEFASLKPENILENNALAFRVAEQQLGIPALLDAEDMVECDIPDRLSVLTYVSQFYQVFSSLGLTSPKRVVNNVSTPPASSPATVKKTKLTPPLPQPKTKTEIKTDKVLLGGRLRREVCVRCSNPVFLAERLLVGSPGQLMHRTCFRCARCTTQLTLASYYETEKGQFCCETCPDEEINISPEDTNSIISGTSPKLSRRTSTSDSESEYESECSENESDGYSNTVELVLEDKTQNDDTLTHSPKVTPGPPKPRTVFLSKTLEGESPVSNLDEHKETKIVIHKEEPKFSHISPALFGSKLKDAARAAKASDSGLDHCDAKGSITDPPDKLTLDTGQGKSSDRVPDNTKDASSSIVAQRLKMFREIGNKTNSTSNVKTNIMINKKEHKGSDLSIQNSEKNSRIPFTEKKSSVLFTEKESSVSFTEKKSSVLFTEKESSVPFTEKESSVPFTEKESSVPFTEKESSVPFTEKESSVPFTEKESSVPFTEKERSVPFTEKESSIPFTVSEPKPYPTKEDVKFKIKDDDKDKLEGAISDADKDEKTESLSVDNILKKDEVDSMPDENIPHKETRLDSTKKDFESVSIIPSITISSEKQEDKEFQVEVEKGEESRVDAITSPVATKERENLKGSDTECNPFDDAEDEESQMEESGVAVTPSPGGGSDVDNNATSLSQDSGAELSTASLRSVQYPDDLNPFGSDDDDMKDVTSVSEPVVIDTCERECKKDEAPAKKLIKVNLNPFESDEDEDSDKEKESKVDDKSESKNLNPFWSDDEEPSESASSTPSKGKNKPPRPPPPTLARNSTPSYMFHKKEASPSPKGNLAEGRKSSITQSPARELFPQPKSSPAPSQKRLSPSLPTANAHPSPSSPSGSVTLRRKARRAPAPPPVFTPKSDGASSSESTADTTSMDTMSLSSLGTMGQVAQEQEEEGQDEVMSRKLQKDMKNHSNKMNGTTEQRFPPPKPARSPQASMNLACSKGGLVRKPSMSKSEAGEWQRKKGPAPPRPVPQKRAIRKMPMRLVQQELHDIEIKQTELERQGVLLETSIRKRTEITSNNPQEDMAAVNSGPSSIEVEDMIMQLFELVNEKNELFRRQTELMYLKREKRLEEEYVELEYQIRCLMLKPPTHKTEVDDAQEEELIARLVKVVEQRDEIINCLELDRLREAQEDESIATHMMQYQEKHIDGIENGCVSENIPTTKKKKTLKLPRKKKKKEKKSKGAKADADKDIDETEVKETKKKKKKWLF